MPKKDIRDLCPESGPLTRRLSKAATGVPLGYTIKNLDFIRRRDEEEFALVIWRALLKRRAPHYVIAGLTKWRHVLEAQRKEREQ